MIQDKLRSISQAFGEEFKQQFSGRDKQTINKIENLAKMWEEKLQNENDRILSLENQNKNLLDELAQLKDKLSVQGYQQNTSNAFSNKEMPLPKQNNSSKDQSMNSSFMMDNTLGENKAYVK